MSRFFGFVFAGCFLAIGTSASAQATNPDWPKSLTMGTAAPGGVYYVYGEAVAKLLTESLKIDVNPLPSQGPVHNVKLVESGGTQLGMVTMGIALQGWNGKGDWTGRATRQEAHRRWAARRYPRYLCSRDHEHSWHCSANLQ